MHIKEYLEQNQIKKCIASSGAHPYVISTLKITNLSQYFRTSHIFNAPIGKGKPEPDVFLHAAKQFRINPKACLVIEDSVLGIEAAKAADMPVIGFLGGSHAQSPYYREQILKIKPTLIAENAIELLGIFKEIFSR